MGGLFSALFGSHSNSGRRASSKVTEHDKAVLELKSQRDRLKQYQKKIENVMKREDEIARQLLRDNKKEKALLALKKKKYQQQLLKKTDTQLENVQHLIDTIEFTQIEKKVLDGLRDGTKALQTLQKEMKIEDVEKIMEESREAIEYQEQIQQLLSESLSSQDEADVSEEVAALEAEVAGKQLSGMKQVPSESLVPEKQPQKAEAIEEAEEEEEPEKETNKKVAVLA